MACKVEGSWRRLSSASAITLDMSRGAYRVDGQTFAAGKPEFWMRIPQGVLWVDPPMTGTRAAAIRGDDKRSESVVLVVNFFDELRRRAPADR